MKFQAIFKRNIKNGQRRRPQPAHFVFAGFARSYIFVFKQFPREYEHGHSGDAASQQNTRRSRSIMGIGNFERFTFFKDRP